MAEKTNIRLLRVETPPRHGSYVGKDAEHHSAVVFQVKDFSTLFEIPVMVDRRAFADPDLVTHAYRILSQTLDALSQYAKKYEGLPAPMELGHPLGNHDPNDVYFQYLDQKSESEKSA